MPALESVHVSITECCPDATPVGAVPAASTVKLAVWPAVTVWFPGWVFIVGAIAVFRLQTDSEPVVEHNPKLLRLEAVACSERKA